MTREPTESREPGESGYDEEGEFAPNYASPPGDTMRDLLDRKGLPAGALDAALGLSSEPAERLLLGWKRITPPLAEKLAAFFGASPGFWLRRDENYVKTRARLARRDFEPCGDSFVKLAKEDPERLIHWIGTLEPPYLTFAAEHLGTHAWGDQVVCCLIDLLDHRNAPVREGAMYGLGNHVELSEVRAALLRASENDPVDLLRKLARELIPG